MRKILLFVVVILLIGAFVFADRADTNDHTHCPNPIPITQTVE